MLQTTETGAKSNDTGRYGRYEVVRKLASGGMGEVYLAKSIGAAGFQKHVVIKKILPHLTEHPQTVKSLVREAKLLVMLNHPNIVQVLDLGVEDGEYFMAMEYVHGYNLSTVLHYCSKKKKLIPFDICAYIGIEVLRALAYAHELRGSDGTQQHIIHRDVSPQNVMISYSGQVKLTDFGVAKVLSAAEDEHTKSLKGKWRYMAPEALDGGRIDQRYDLFAVGILVFEALCRRNLFSGKRDVDILNQVREARVPDILRYHPEAPPALIEVTEKALARDPSHRYQTARTLTQALIDAIRPVAESECAEHLHKFVTSIYAASDFPLNKPKIRDPNVVDPDATRSIILKSRISEVPGGELPRAGTGRLAVGLLSLGLVAVSVVVGFIAYTLYSRSPDSPRDVPQFSVEKRPADAASTPPRAPDLTMADSSSLDAKRGPRSARGHTGSSIRHAPPPAKRFTEAVGRMAFGKQLPKLIRCFKSHQGHDNFKIKSKILRSGKVAAVQLVPKTLGATPFGRCVIKVAQSVRYPRHNAEYVNFTQPVKIGN